MTLMNADLLDVRSFSAFDDQILICVDDRTHRRLIEGVAAQLGLQPQLVSADHLTNVAFYGGVAMIVADEWTAGDLRRMSVSSPVLTNP